MTFLCVIALRNKTAANTLFSSFDNANDCLCRRDVTLLCILKKPECRQIRSNVFRFIDNFPLRS